MARYLSDTAAKLGRARELGVVLDELDAAALNELWGRAKAEENL